MTTLNDRPKAVWLGLLLLAIAPCAVAQSADWPAVSPADLALKDNPASPGDAAMLLYREVNVDDEHRQERHYGRIKIFRSEGTKYADVQIPYAQKTEVIEVRGRTVRADGTVTPFTGQVFEKVLYRQGKVKVYAKAFTLPGVDPGSVIEYSYTLKWKEKIPDVFRHPYMYLLDGAYTWPTSTWTLQRDLYTRKAVFRLKPVKNVPLKWTAVRMGGLTPEARADGSVQLTVENVKPIPQEDYQPPESMLTSPIHFYYSVGAVWSSESFWKDVARRQATELEDFIGKSSGVQKRELEALLRPEDTAETKVRKIYDRVQKLRYLSYETSKSEKEMKATNIEKNKSVDDVLRRGYAATNEVNWVFLALLRGAGFRAWPVSLVARYSGAFEIDVLDESQLNASVIEVMVGDQDHFFDPATKFCPYGELPWYEASVGVGLRLDRHVPGFVRVPSLGNESAQGRRAGKLRLTADGTLSGTVEMTFTGQNAMGRRIEALYQDAVARKKSVEEEVKAMLPEGAKVTLEGSEGWDTPMLPLKFQVSIEVPQYGVATGQRLLVPGSVFHSTRRQLFESPTRNNPIHFSYPFHEVDVFEIEFPRDLTLEGLPSPVWETYSFGQYKKDIEQKEGRLILERDFYVDGIYFPTSFYVGMRELYRKVRTKDDEKLVLRRQTQSGQ